MSDDAAPDAAMLADEARLAEYARALADALGAALPRWVEREVRRLAAAWGAELDADAVVLVTERGTAAKRDVGGAVRALLDTDIDLQRTSPLAIVRSAVRYPSEVLEAIGVPHVVRDPTAVRQFPADRYDLTPGSFADIDESLREPALVWGAAKAHVHLQRRRRESERRPPVV